MSQKRLLTAYEIQDILSFIKLNKSIPKDAAIAIVKNNKKRLQKQLTGQLIYPEIIPQLKLELEKQYMTTLIQPGENVGIIMAQSIGEKQTQMVLNSVDWTDKILYSINGTVKVQPIGQMIDQLLKNNPENIQLVQEKQTEYLPLPDGYLIPSGDKHGFNEWRKIEAVTRHLPQGKLVKVTTQSGRVVRASQCKSFLVWNGISFEDTLGSEVKVGDILPSSKYMPRLEKPQEYFDMESIFPKNKYIYSTEIVKAREFKAKSRYWWKHNGTGFVTPYKRGDTLFGRRKEIFMNIDKGFIYLPKATVFVSNIPDKIPLDNDFGFLLGIYLAEGCVTKTFVCISNNDPIIRKRVTDWLDRYGVTYHLVVKEAKNVRNGTSSDLKIHSVLMARMFKIMCDTGSANKFVPEFAYTAPDEFIKGLLDGYFSGDGCVQLRGDITVSSVSEQLIQGISFLLSYYGIFGHMSSFQQKNNNVGSENIKRTYLLNIRNGFAQKFTKEIPLTSQSKQDRLTNITLEKEYKYDCGRNQEEYPQERDVYFDPIVSIEHVEATNGVVYDFTVAETRNFNLFNGLNQRDTFHTAGKGNKNVTQGVPRFSELLNATKSPKGVNCFIYFNGGNTSIPELRETIGDSIVNLTFKNIIKGYEVMIDKEDEPWYEAYKIMYDDKFTQFRHCLSLKLNMDLLYEYKLTIEDIASVITDNYVDMSCVCSPDQIGKLDIFVDTSDIKLPEDREIFVDQTDNTYLQDVIYPQVKNMCIEDMKFEDIISNYEVTIDKEPETWYKEYKIKYRYCLSLQINTELLEEHKNTLENITNTITESTHINMSCVFSPNEIGQIDIFVDMKDIRNTIEDIYLEEVVYPIVENMSICGIDGITDLFFNRDGDNWMIETNGSNLPELFAHPDVDMSRTFSNNMWDIYNTLGIEATRQFLIEEYNNILSGINLCHVKILVDRMTIDGTLSSISRYTMRSTTSGPLSKLSFEETLDNSLRAGIFGHIDKTTGVSASIICGKRANIGTGICELKMNIPMLATIVEDSEDEDEEKYEEKPKKKYIKRVLE